MQNNHQHYEVIALIRIYYSFTDAILNEGIKMDAPGVDQGLFIWQPRLKCQHQTQSRHKLLSVSLLAVALMLQGHQDN
jgi:hypothetical protein